MKAGYQTQRRRPSPSGPGISLFPFLAVLICTMGALVPLLLAITRTARLQAETAAAAEQETEQKTQQEDVAWRSEQLKQSRASAETQLANARLELGHIEDHSRRLRDRLMKYQATVADLQRVKDADRQRLTQSQAEFEQLGTQIRTAQQQLAEAKPSAANRCYAVVPYEGPNQTHRQPIYLECRDDAIVLQPEGIELTESDFEGPLGPGNPLAAALRAAREYRLSGGTFDSQAGDPYPMLLVRPEGINAYYAAREAMKSWGFDFGYELVEAGWKLAYPSPDPRLAEVVRQVVASARASQARLAAAAPRHYQTRTKVAYRAAPGGGFVREAVAANDEDRGYSRTTPSGPVGRAEPTGVGPPDQQRLAPARVPGGSGGAGSGPPSPGGDRGYSTGDESIGSGAAGGTVPGGTVAGSREQHGSENGTVSGGASGDLGGDGPALTGNGIGGGSSSSGSGSSSAMPSQSSPHPSPLPRGDGTGTERPEGYVVGQPLREQTASNNRQHVSEGAQAGRVLRPGEWEPSPDRPPPKRDEKDDDKHRGRHSLAEKRGTDWGLRDAARGSVGMTRPIRVACYADRLVILSERGADDNKTIALGPRTATSIDALISAVWEHMESWGMAGRGMYWRPLLHVYVASDAESRFTELSALLDGSGVLVERK